MRVFVARAALLFTFALGAHAGGGVAVDGGQLAFSGPAAVEARMQADRWWCGQDLDTGDLIPCPGREDKRD